MGYHGAGVLVPENGHTPPQLSVGGDPEEPAGMRSEDTRLSNNHNSFMYNQAGGSRYKLQ